MVGRGSFVGEMTVLNRRETASATVVVESSFCELFHSILIFELPLVHLSSICRTSFVCWSCFRLNGARYELRPLLVRLTHFKYFLL